MSHSLSEAPLAPAAATAFGLSWAESWNRGDLEAVLAHFAEDCCFESPFAEKYAGSTRVLGKAALRAYWQKALRGIGGVHFAVDFVATCAEARAITIVYRARLGERQLHACERLIFDEGGRVAAGMGLYGPPVITAPAPAGDR